MEGDCYHALYLAPSGLGYPLQIKSLWSLSFSLSGHFDKGKREGVRRWVGSTFMLDTELSLDHEELP